MKTLSLLLLTLIYSTLIYSQSGEADAEGYIEIPSISEKMKVEGKLLSGVETSFKYIPTYEYKDALHIGTYVKMRLDGIKNANHIGDDAFVFYKQSMAIAGGDVVLKDEHWQTAAIIEEEGKDTKMTSLFVEPYWQIRGAFEPGNYVWTVEFADICTQKMAKVSVEFTVSFASNIAVTTSADVGISTTYFWNAPNEYLYAGPVLYQGEVDLPVHGISGFTIKDGLAKIGVGYKILTEDGTLLEDVKDMAEGKNAFFETTNNEFRVIPSLNLGEKYVGQTITYVLFVWDKENTDNWVKVEAKFLVR